jgi:hypothetical protein
MVNFTSSFTLMWQGRATIVEGGLAVRSPGWGSKQFLLVLYLLCRMIGQKGQTTCLPARLISTDCIQLLVTVHHHIVLVGTNTVLA